jgi:hypothetical protein
MRIIIDGWHKGEIIDRHRPTAEIKLLKPKSMTVCDWIQAAALAMSS